MGVNTMSQTKQNKQQFGININLDTTPIYFTDSIMMHTNEDGVVLDVCQKLGPTNKIRIVSRIGMSQKHAKKFLQKFGELLVKTEGQLVTSKTKH
jgi:hypothetical protein